MPRCTNVVALRARLMRERHAKLRQRGLRHTGQHQATRQSPERRDAEIGISGRSCWSIAAGLTASSGGALAKLACRAADSNAHSAFHRGQLAARGPIVRPDGGSTHGILLSNREASDFTQLVRAATDCPAILTISISQMEAMAPWRRLSINLLEDAKLNFSSTALLSTVTLAVVIPQTATTASAAAPAVQSVTPQSSVNPPTENLLLKELNISNPA